MFNTILPVGTQKVKTQAIFFLIHTFQQIIAQGDPLGGVNHAFKN